MKKKLKTTPQIIEDWYKTIDGERLYKNPRCPDCLSILYKDEIENEIIGIACHNNKCLNSDLYSEIADKEGNHEIIGISNK